MNPGGGSGLGLPFNALSGYQAQVLVSPGLMKVFVLLLAFHHSSVGKF
jgi:hypothetical protein